MKLWILAAATFLAMYYALRNAEDGSVWGIVFFALGALTASAFYVQWLGSRCDQ